MKRPVHWPARDHLIVLAGLALVAATGWLALAYMRDAMGPDNHSMAGMAMPAPLQGVTPGYGLALGMWAVMMLAMMAPAIGPGASAYLALARCRHPGRSALPTAIGFSAGYLAAWLFYAALGAALQSLLAQAMLLTPMGAITSAYLGAGILVAAGAYQLTPLKRMCISRCRNPLMQLMSGWRDGPGGAVRLGFSQGRWCIGCCWALMALMFVAGVMNLAWMAVLSAFILIEKLAPARWRLDTVAGLLLIAWAAWLIGPLVLASL